MARFLLTFTIPGVFSRPNLNEMKRCLALMALMVLVTATGLAQERIRKSVFGASTGVSIPYMELAKKTFRYDAGFAAPGLNIGAEYLYYGNYFGFSSSIGYSSLFFNEKAYRAEYDRTLDGYGTNTVSAGNYQVLEFLTGFTLKLPETEYTEVMLLFHLGIALCVHPDLIVTNSEYGVINSIDRNTGVCPAANAGIKVNHWLNDRYGVSFNCNLSSATPFLGDATGPGGSFQMPIKFANINFGFVMNLKSPAL